METYKDGDVADLPDGNVLRYQAGKWHKYDAGGMEVLGGGYRRNQIGQVYETGPRGGTKMMSGPTFTAANDAQKTATGINQSLAGIDRFDSQLKRTGDIGPLGWLTNPSDIAVTQQSAKDLLLKLKEQPYNMGVLNGPDLPMLESIVADPGRLKSAAFRKTIAPRLANLSSIMGDSYRQQVDGFEGLGGRPEALPPLYRSPQSKFTPEQWGRKGEVPRSAYDAKPVKKGDLPSPVYETTKRMRAEGRIDAKAQLGSQGNPYIARSHAVADKLPKGSYVITPEGHLGVVE